MQIQVEYVFWGILSTFQPSLHIVQIGGGGGNPCQKKMLLKYSGFFLATSSADCLLLQISDFIVRTKILKFLSQPNQHVIEVS